MSEVVSPSPIAEESLTGDVAVDPSTGRPAGRAQAVVLLLASCLGVLGAVLLAPVLPDIEDAFAGTAGVHADAQVAAANATRSYAASSAGGSGDGSRAQ